MTAAPRWWRPGLVLVVAVAVAVRLAFALLVAPDLPMPGDAKVYREMAAHLADGEGLSLPGVDTDELQPTAEHPPLFPGLLAVLDLLALDSPGGQRTVLALLSGLGVAVVALLGRRVGGPAVGIGAAGIAAVHPLWFQSAGMIMSEALHLVLVPAVVLAGARLAAQPGRRAALLLGATVGVAALNRPESLGFLVVVGVPAIIMAARPWPRRVVLGGLVGVACLALVAPWVLRNEVQLGAPTMATNSGKTLLGSNCTSAYAGPSLGGFDYTCFFGVATYLVEVGPPGGGQWDGLSFDRSLGDVGRQFIDDHRGQVPKVVAARIARMWGLRYASDQLAFDVLEGRHRSLQRAGQGLHLALLPFAAAGAVIALGRHRREALLLLGIPVLVTSTTLLVYGGTRMRSGAEPAIAVFAAYAAVEVARRVRRPAKIPSIETPDGSLTSA